MDLRRRKINVSKIYYWENRPTPLRLEQTNGGSLLRGEVVSGIASVKGGLWRGRKRRDLEHSGDKGGGGLGGVREVISNSEGHYYLRPRKNVQNAEADQAEESRGFLGVRGQLLVRPRWGNVSKKGGATACRTLRKSRKIFKKPSKTADERLGKKVGPQGKGTKGLGMGWGSSWWGLAMPGGNAGEG